MAHIEPGAVPLAAACISMALCLLLAPLARRVGWMDQPSRRKVHTKPVPLVGGFAIFLTMAIVIWLATPFGREAIPLLLACGLLMVVGLVDDRRGLSPAIRLVVSAT